MVVQRNPWYIGERRRLPDKPWFDIPHLSVLSRDVLANDVSERLDHNLGFGFFLETTCKDGKGILAQAIL